MAEFPALPLWTDAYLADTRHLTTAEHGAYLLLLIEAWRRPRCSIPDNDVLLARLVMMAPAEWAKAKPVVMAFWTLDRRRKEWTQKRLLRERTFVARKRASQRHNAVRRWKNEEKDHAVAMPSGMPNRCQIDAPTPTPTIESLSLTLTTESLNPDSEAGGGAGGSVVALRAPTGLKNGHLKEPRGTRLPEDWEPGEEGIAYARSFGFSDERINDLYNAFRDFWLAKAGAAARKVSWARAWKTWARREHERVREQKHREAVWREQRRH